MKSEYDIPEVDRKMREIQRKLHVAKMLKEVTGNEHCLSCLNPLTKLGPYDYRCDACSPHLRISIG